MKQIYTLVVFTLLAVAPAMAQQKSPKRGMGWDEKTQKMSQAPLSKMAPGVSWIYNWGATPANDVANLGPGKDIEFVPMAWNGGYDDDALRAYLTAHPGVKYLLGFNEPNFSAQSNMTPAKAAAAWPNLEKIAKDFNLKLVAPALNFTGESVGGKVWGIYDWYDEFFRLYPNAKLDYLALHCYMNWAENVQWFATKYFYDEDNLYKAENKAAYPNLVAYLDRYKAANGHFPQMFLTEFCSWEDNTYPNYAGLTMDFQIDQMTQKLQYLEQSDLVAGYAWFMANPGGGQNEHPHESIFVTNTATSELSTLGKVYVYMSSFDKSKSYASGETILAKDYIDASVNNQQVKLRPNTESGSSIPLQVEFQASSWATYQIAPASGETTIRLHMKSTADARMGIYRNGNVRVGAFVTVPSTNGVWADREINVTLPEGVTELKIYSSTAGVLLNSLTYTVASGIGNVQASQAADTDTRYFNLSGQQVSPSFKGTVIEHSVAADGTVHTRKVQNR